jgi:hypothetical protein
MTTGSKVDQFNAKDDVGKIYTIVEYRTSQQSNEIRSDRMSQPPTIGQEFKTLEGRAVEKITEDTFQIMGSDKIVRKI